jgi:hypothetical protein
LAHPAQGGVTLGLEQGEPGGEFLLPCLQNTGVSNILSKSSFNWFSVSPRTTAKH